MLKKVLSLGVFCSVALFSQARADDSVEAKDKSGNCNCPKKRVVLCAQFNDDETKNDEDNKPSDTTVTTATETSILAACCPGKTKPTATAQVEPEQTDINTPEQAPENAIVQGKVA